MNGEGPTDKPNKAELSEEDASIMWKLVDARNDFLDKTIESMRSFTQLLNRIEMDGGTTIQSSPELARDIEEAKRIQTEIKEKLAGFRQLHFVKG